MQTDGNVAVYNNGHATFATGTSTGVRLTLQADGNLVEYDAAGHPLWSSGTAGTASPKLVMQTDGNLVEYGSAGAVWATETSDATLWSGGTLHRGQYLQSSDAAELLVLQGDGNLALYTRGHAIWSTGTSTADTLSMQADGNLVLYAAGKAVWNTRTAGAGSGDVVLQADGNLVLYAGGAARWSTGTHANTLFAPSSLAASSSLASPDGSTVLDLQHDGNLVLYRDGAATWSAGIAGRGADELRVQADGNIVAYAKGRAVWQTGTTTAASLTVQDDGNLVAYNGSGAAVWQSGTSPAPPASDDPRTYARSQLAAFGWGQDQFTPLNLLWNSESGWNVHASNPSGAYGIPQALPGVKMAQYGSDWQDNAKTQITWGLHYIQDRYGSPANAWAAHQQQGWY